MTLAIVICLNLSRNASIRRLSILLAIVLGSVLAYLFGFGDFSKVGNGAWVQFPSFFAFGMPTFELSAIISMLIVTLVIMTETTADIIAVGEIVGTQVDSERISNGLRADMFSSAVAPILVHSCKVLLHKTSGWLPLPGLKAVLWSLLAV